MQSLLEHNYNFNKSDFYLKSIDIKYLISVRWGLLLREGSINSKVIMAILNLNGSNYLASLYRLSPKPHILLSLLYLFLIIDQN